VEQVRKVEGKLSSRLIREGNIYREMEKGSIKGRHRD
jgi:hypothetical protein